MIWKHIANNQRLGMVKTWAVKITPALQHQYTRWYEHILLLIVTDLTGSWGPQ